MKVILHADDPRWPRIIELQRQTRAEGIGRRLISTAYVTRKYSRAELAAASLFHVRTLSAFEPAGEECGTTYDESDTCPVCGAGRRRIGQLRLNLRKVPKGVDLTDTIARDELIVSERLAAAIRTEGLTGVDLEPVVHHGRSATVLSHWFALKITSEPFELSLQTRFGTSLCDLENGHACPVGDTAGLNLLSEVRVRPPTAGLADFNTTRQYYGNRISLLMPFRPLLLSPRAERVLARLNARRLNIEVAHLD